MEPVLQAHALDLHIISELEAALEGSRGDTLVERVSVFSSVACFSPQIASLFSLVSIERSASVKPATTTEMR